MFVKGERRSAEFEAKRIASLMANPEWLRKSSERMTKLNAQRTGKHLSEEHKNKIAKANRGKQYALGTVRSHEYKKHLSDYWKDNPLHNHWVDGKGWERTSARQKDMQRLEYREWRKSVFERDDYTCQFCGIRGGKLVADHVKPYNLYPELRHELSNGRTLCDDCHRKTDTYGIKSALSYNP